MLLKRLVERSRAAVRKLRWKLREIRNPETMRSVYGPLFVSNCGDATFRFYIDGSYGAFLSDYLRSIERPFVFVDVGANQGLYSLIAETNAKCRLVYAFEPVQRTFALLRRNIKLNGAERIVALPYAISKDSGQKQIYVSPRHSGAASIEDRGPGLAAETISCVSSKGIEDLLTLPMGVEIFVKIDTEGHEPVVIEQLRRTGFWQRVSGVFFEVDHSWYDSVAMIKQLEGDEFVEAGRTETDPYHYDVLMTREATFEVG